MKKKILFVIPNLVVGGAEKSLVTLLNTLDYSKFEVDLLLFRNGEGLLLNQVPKTVRLLSTSTNYQVFERRTRFPEFYFILRGRFDLALSRLRCRYTLASIPVPGLAEQAAWRYTKRFHAPVAGTYDVAVAFLEKSSIYFVVDFVTAPTKIGFIHNDYTQLGLDAAFDLPYFEQLTSVATVSSGCVASLAAVFPSLKAQFKLVPNIVSAPLIAQMAAAETIASPVPILLSIGRLHEQKGFDLAIAAASLLVAQGISFVWYVLGEGGARAALEQQIATAGLASHFILLGVKENPYPYLKAAAVYVQPSRYEGKSIALDEAKLLKKPIVVTNFSTVRDQITDGVTGVVVDFDAASLAAGLVRVLTDSALRTSLVQHLEHEPEAPVSALASFYELL